MSMSGINPLKLAAVVYDDGVSVDALMTDFSRELIVAGVAARGVVQLPPDAAGCGPAALMSLQMVRSGEIIRMCQDLGPGSMSCALNPEVFTTVGMTLRQEASEDCDIMFISKFGKQEANGKGLRDEIAFVIASGCTLLTAVKRPLAPKWLQFTGGQGTLLDARAWVLRDWWSEVTMPRRAAA